MKLACHPTHVGRIATVEEHGSEEGAPQYTHSLISLHYAEGSHRVVRRALLQVQSYPNAVV